MLMMVMILFDRSRRSDVSCAILLRCEALMEHPGAFRDLLSAWSADLHGLLGT